MTIHECSMRLGIVLLPKHYYVPVPDLRELRRTRRSWARRSEMRGVYVDLDQQATMLDRLVKPFEPEYRNNTAFKTATDRAFGPGFGFIEAQALYGFVRGTKPRRIIEVGSGISTFCMVQALAQNAAEGVNSSLTCIEPYPSAWLRNAPVTLIDRKIEELGLELFEDLQSGDLLFIDSTHTVRVGGDVVRIVTEILPLLRKGVYVHFHDIYLPYDFQRDVDRSVFHWMETALLHAYLIDNSRMSIVFCLSHLHYDRPDRLLRVFPEYVRAQDTDGLQTTGEPQGHFPSSLYLCVAEDARGGD